MAAEIKKRLKRDDYTVAIVCPLEVEMSAVRYMLDAEHARLPSQEGDENRYIFGEMSGHNVVIGFLPYGSQGIGAAAAVATDMRRTFPAIQLRLLVGIGGGVPSRTNDIRIGDVVVGMPSGIHGGVVQYGLGKETTTGFERKCFLQPPPKGWRDIIVEMQSDHRLKGNRISEFLYEMIRKYPQLKAYQRPAPEKDILFVRDNTHAPYETTCDKCDKDRVVRRPPRHPDGPAMFYGLIASGDRVIKNAETRDKISHDAGGVLCFEMEAAGLVNDFQCVIIRGIADYADSHKNDDWHPYAAAAAAGCAKELLTYMVPLVETRPENRTTTSDQPRKDSVNREEQLTYVDFPSSNVSLPQTLIRRELEGSGTSQTAVDDRQQSTHLTGVDIGRIARGDVTGFSLTIPSWSRPKFRLSNCGCICHIPRRMPPSYRRLFNAIYSRYTGYVFSEPGCSACPCRAEQSVYQANFTATLPPWLADKALQFTLLQVDGAKKTWQFCFSYRNRLPWGCDWFVAAYNGDIDCLKDLLVNGKARPNDQDYDYGSTALELALSFGRFEICQFLIKAGADPYIQQGDKQSAFDGAWEGILSKREDDPTQARWKELFPRGDLLDDWQLTNTHKIVMGLMFGDLEAEIRKSSLSINTKDKFGHTALWWAAHRGDYEATRVLLEHGADTSIVDVQGSTAIHEAVRAGRTEVVQLLRDIGADLTVADIWGCLPLHIATFAHDDAELLDLLLKPGMDIDVREASLGQTALQYAAKLNHVTTVKFLIEQGADMNATDDYGDTALFVSIMGRAPSSIEFLFGQGADYNHRNKAGKTILHYAAEYGDLDVLQKLDSHRLEGLDFQIRDNAGRTAFQVYEEDKAIKPFTVKDALASLFQVVCPPLPLIELENETSFERSVEKSL